MRNKNRIIVLGALLVMAIVCLIMFEPWLSKKERITRLVQTYEVDLVDLAEVVREKEGIEGLRFSGVREITYRTEDATVEFLCYAAAKSEGFCYAPDGAPAGYHYTEPITGGWYYFREKT